MAYVLVLSVSVAANGARLAGPILGWAEQVIEVNAAQVPGVREEVEDQ